MYRVTGLRGIGRQLARASGHYLRVFDSRGPTCRDWSYQCRSIQTSYTCCVSSRRSYAGAPPAPTSDWPEHEYLAVANEMLESIFESVLNAGEENAFGDDFDAELSQGVLRIALGDDGDYVINTQTPNRQIWLSSPSSGPWRFGWDSVGSEWISTKGNERLIELLERELGEIASGASEVRIKGPVL